MYYLAMVNKKACEFCNQKHLYNIISMCVVTMNHQKYAYHQFDTNNLLNTKKLEEKV